MFLQTYMFGFVYANSGVRKSLLLATLAITCIASHYYIKTYQKPLKFLSLFVIINSLTCMYFRDQSLFQYYSGKEFISLLGLLSMFAMPYFKVSPYKLEKLIQSFAIFFIFVYLLQYFLPIPVFKEIVEAGNVDLDARLRMPGQALISLIGLFSFAKLTNAIEWKSAVFFGLSCLCLLILDFRSQLAAFALCIVVLLFSMKKMSKRTIVVVVFLCVGVIGAVQTPVVQNKIDQIAQRQERGDNFDNDKYARVRSYEAFTQELPKNNIERIFGLGLPNGNSEWGKTVDYLKNFSVVWSDWGLIGLSWMLGIPGVFCLLWYCVIALRLPVKKEHYYLKVWILYMLIASILTREFFREGNYAIQGGVLFLISELSRINNSPKEVRK